MAEYDFTQIVRQVAAAEQIADVKLEHQYSTDKGDGYLGTVRAVRLVGSNRTLDVVFKYSHRDPKAHTKLPLRKCYLNEIYFYEQVAPTFTRFQQQHNVRQPFNNFAKFYGAITEPLNELLVLENLKSSQYDLWNRRQLMNRAHLEYALRTFAKFHGTSFAMRTLDAKQFAALTQSLRAHDLFTDFIHKMGFHHQMQEAIKALVNIFDAGDEAHYHAKFKAFSTRVREEIDAALAHHADDVILQGDCWCNNAMYRYADLADRALPCDMKMLDFQLVKLGSPVLDLSYFFYTISPKESYDDLEHYLKLYHDTMGAHLKEFGVDIVKVYSYDTFTAEWRKLCRFGLILAVLLRKVMLTESDGAPDITENAEEFVNKLTIDKDTEKIYQDQIKELVKHFIDKKFI